ncbi:MAG: hypothetical protein J6R59_00275 [Paludibacteraceae bacterium]|nr:hypothetical protein [Paludibacteraceae bacterium]
MFSYEENEKVVNKAIKNCLNENTWVRHRITNKLKNHLGEMSDSEIKKIWLKMFSNDADKMRRQIYGELSENQNPEVIIDFMNKNKISKIK